MKSALTKIKDIKNLYHLDVDPDDPKEEVPKSDVDPDDPKEEVPKSEVDPDDPKEEVPKSEVYPDDPKEEVPESEVDHIYILVTEVKNINKVITFEIYFQIIKKYELKGNFK